VLPENHALVVQPLVGVAGGHGCLPVDGKFDYRFETGTRPQAARLQKTLTNKVFVVVPLAAAPCGR